MADSPGALSASDLWRLSPGLGYSFSSHLTLKLEYMVEHGQLAIGRPRNHENMIATEAAFKFLKMKLLALTCAGLFPVI